VSTLLVRCVIVAVALVAGLVLVDDDPDHPDRALLRGGAARAAPARTPVVNLGRSVRGRPIDAVQVGTARRSRADLLVVGCIHGDEPAGIEVTAALRRTLARAPLSAWLVDDLNPDGRSRGTRQDARGVDLNRNFPYRWRPLGPPGSRQYAGPRPLSEPEARIAYRLISRVRPRIAIWLHQPLGVVDESGGSVAIERRFAGLADLPFKRLTRYPGSAVGWENHAVPGSTAFVVELGPGRLSPARGRALARAIRALVANPGSSPDSSPDKGGRRLKAGAAPHRSGQGR
jgi:murein peptide amidase A